MICQSLLQCSYPIVFDSIFIMRAMNEQIDGISHAASTTPQNLQKIQLMTSNILRFKSIIKGSLLMAALRIAFFFVIIANDKQFITTAANTPYSDSWNVIFYIIASLLDFLVVLNDVQILRFLGRDAHNVGRVRTELESNSTSISNTALGAYTNYLSLYDLIKCFKLKAKSLVSISQTVRYLQVIITFYAFGNLALNAQNKNQTSIFKSLVLWLFILSKYFNIFELDFLNTQMSSGAYVQPKAVAAGVNVQDEEGQQFTQIKDNYIKRIRRPFEIIYLINILLLLTVITLFFEVSLLSFMMIFCAITHMAELVYEKYLQNHLLTTKLATINKEYLTPYLLLFEVTKETKVLHMFLTTINRIAIVMTIMAYFRSLETTVAESFMFFFVNILLFLGQHVKFLRVDNGKLYFLRSKRIDSPSQAGIECSICLLNCERGDRVVELPCFANHIYHFSCMGSWFKERKECPLCRQSLQIYDLMK